MHDFLGNAVEVGDEISIPCKIIEVVESDTCNIRVQPVNQPDRNRIEDFWTIAGCCFKDIKKGMTFGLAIEAMKQGLKVARTGWNGKGMFLYYVPENEYPASTEIALAYYDGGMVPYGDYIAMKTADENVVPWLASQTDILAEDWVIVD